VKIRIPQFFSVISLVIMLLIIPTDAVTAQLGCEPIAYNQTRTESVNDDIWGWSYCFDGNMGDSIEITMVATSGNLDTYLELLDSAGNSLVSNDDADKKSTNSLIQFILPTTGAYSIYAGRYDASKGKTTGNFELSLTSTTVAPTTGSAPGRPSTDVTGTTTLPVCDSIIVDAVETEIGVGITPITYNQPVSNEIDNSNPFGVYCFEGVTGDVLSISLNVESGDIYLGLYDLAFEEVAVSEDAKSPIEITLTKTEQYFILVGTIEGLTHEVLVTSSSGTAQTNIGSALGRPPIVAVTPTPGSAPGRPSIGTVTPTTGSAPGRPSIVAVTPTTGSAPGRPSIGTVTPTTGSAPGRPSTETTPILVCEKPLSVTVFLPLYPNQPQFDTIDATNKMYTYCFEGVTGETVSISEKVLSGNLDPYIELTTNTFDEVDGTTTSSSPSYDLIFEATLSATGQYFVFVMTTDNLTTGAYELVLTKQ
jgi:hypothetical protein